MEKYLIVGLGNPGIEYSKTRHQVGSIVLNNFAIEHNLVFRSNIFKAEIADFDINGKKIFLAKPTTYMNLSGEFVNQFLKYYQIPIENLFVIYDDISLPIGTFKMKWNGSSGGHNGIRNIIQMLKTEEFKRLKIGILDKELLNKTTIKDYVLKNFSSNEMQKIQELQPYFNQIIVEFPSLEFQKLLSKYNKK